MKVYFIVFIALLGSCSLVSKEEKKLATLRTGNGDIIEIFYVATGATSNEVIQVRTPLLTRGSASYEYSRYYASELKEDSLLTLIVGDSSMYGVLKDTILVRLNSPQLR